MEFLKFYNDVGQQLTKWVPQAPKIKVKEAEESPIPTILTEARETDPRAFDKNK